MSFDFLILFFVKGNQLNWLELEAKLIAQYINYRFKNTNYLNKKNEASQLRTVDDIMRDQFSHIWAPRVKGEDDEQAGNR